MSIDIMEKKFEYWKNNLLDVGKRNKMINYRKTKRATLQIVDPGYDELYQRLVNADEEISFKKAIDCSDDLQLTQLFYLFDKLGKSVSITTGVIDSDLTLSDTQSTLKNLRSKAKLSLEEQGINILYLCFGFIEWRQKATDNYMLSPLILVPVTLSLASVTEPYKIKRLEEDVVVNPTLEYFFESEYSISLPTFDSSKDDLNSYFDEVQKSIKPMGWNVVREANLGLLSFLKIVMYKDLVKYKERLFKNPVINAFCGDASQIPVVESEWVNYNHDLLPAQETYQVVNADSSQQDAILLSKKGVSFVLQGPPGTGKSQTIANIIAEGLADGKRILFVSEKMAALSVVYNRLKDVHLTEYCLSLHNYKANKKEVIAELVDTLDAPAKTMNEGALDFYTRFDQEKTKLNQYFTEIFKVIEPLHTSVYDVLTQLVSLDHIEYIHFNMPVDNVTAQEYQKMLVALKEYRDFQKNYVGDLMNNPWRNTKISMLTLEQKNEIHHTITQLLAVVNHYRLQSDQLKKSYDADNGLSLQEFQNLIDAIAKMVMLKMLDERVQSFCEEIFSRQLDRAKLKEYIATADAFSINLQSVGVDTCEVDSEEKRNLLLTQYDEVVHTARRIQHFIQEFNASFDMDFIFGVSGLERLKAFSRILLSVDDIDVDWIIKGKLPKAKEQAKNMSELVQNILNLKTELDKGNYAETCDASTDKTDIKNAEEILKYYENSMNSCSAKRQEVSELSKAIKQWKIQLEEEGIALDFVDNEQERRLQISGIQQGINEIQKFLRMITEINTVYGTNYRCTLQDLEPIKCFLAMLLLPYNITEEWLDLGNLNKMRLHAEKMSDLMQQANKLKDKLMEKWEPEFLNFDYQEILNRFMTDYLSFFKRLGSSYKRDKLQVSLMRKNKAEKLSDSVIIEELTRLRNYIQLRKEYEGNSEVSSQYCAGYYLGFDTDWNYIKTAIKNCEEQAYYHQNVGFSEKTIEELKKDYAVRRKTLIGEWSVNDVISNDMVSGFTTLFEEDSESTAEELLKIKERKLFCLTGVDRCCDEISQFIVNTFEAEKVHLDESDKSSIFNMEQIAQVLECLRKYYALRLEYQSNAEINRDYFGKRYSGFRTSWKYIMDTLDTCDGLYDYHKENGLSDKAVNALRESLMTRKERTIAQCTFADIALGGMCEEYEKFFEAHPSKIEDTISVIEKKHSIVSEISDFWTSMNNLITKSYVQEKEERKLAAISNLSKVTTRINEKKEQLEDLLKNQGIAINSTSWDAEVSLACEYISKNDIEANVDRYVHDFKDELFENNNNWLEECLTYYESIHSLLDEEENYSKFDKWFDSDKEKLNQIPLNELYHHIEACQDLMLLESWIEFKDIINQCSYAGLDEYIQFIMEGKYEAGRVVPVFRKAFLMKWIYSLLEKDEYAYIRQFKEYAHNGVIRDFKLHDEKQLLWAQARLAAKLSQEKPSGNRILNNAQDEASILRRESEKKRKIMPLRRLFKEIPNLLQRLKPCFMMSPLSVSYFLDSDMYEFDMVIFDEASQILPEDAVGAIYRGKQVIIAGDTKQMPPTNFFSSTAKNADDLYDNEDEDEEYQDISESILDEANICLPSCTLLWHYRSKDESLIAFSNKEIYGNKLITFPNCKKTADKGLEYIYVANGYYEGKGKNCNVAEADRCVELVEEHIKKYPERSLGIIAFSEKQQGVIEDAVSNFRTVHPEYNDFFSEEKEEPFFVKNLENVQGDERDTIIFSICYAKNKEGRMFMRFGPLGHAGGERRLNVAITRAKYNVKLVGSIMPDDIDMKKTQQEGVKLLREYITYAMQDDYNIPQGGSGDVPEEQFTELISDFLIENGYSIRRNVGASKYKVDIAVVNSSDPSEYIAGIECDGANYNMTRTARERDVLRNSVMSSMGWNLYHVWTVSWFKNMEEEKIRLLNYLKEKEVMLSQESGKKKIQIANSFEPTIEQQEEIYFNLVSVTEPERKTEVLEFPHYCVCNPWEAKQVYGDDNLRNVARRIMWVLEHEQPIHKELLYKRLAEVFGREKATEPVRRAVNAAIDHYLRMKIIERDSFLYLRDTEIQARIPETEDDIRVIDYICIEEIQDAMKKIVEFALGLSEADLFSETARTFKFARTGAKIREAFTKAFEDLMTSGQLYRSSGKIYRRED